MSTILKRIVVSQVPNVLIEDLSILLRAKGDSINLLEPDVKGRPKRTLEQISHSTSLDGLVKAGKLKLYDENGLELTGTDALRATEVATLHDITSSGGAVSSVNGEIGVVSLSIDDITDVDTTGFPLVINDVLQWNGAVWKPSTLSGAALTTFTDLMDTPNAYTDKGNFLLRVKSTIDGIEFTDGSLIYAGVSHSHAISDITGLTATTDEINLLDLAGLTSGYVLRASDATTASWSQLKTSDLNNDSSFISNISAFSTTDLSEGTNLYYTDEKVDDRVSSLIQNGTGISWTYDDNANTLTPAISLSSFSTTDLSEGTNLYYTDEKVDDRVSSLIQNGTGITWTYSDVGNTLTPAISLSSFSTTDLSEGTNLYYTDEKVDDRVSSLLVAGTGISLTYADVANTLTVDWTGGSSSILKTGWDVDYYTSITLSFNESTMTLSVSPSGASFHYYIQGVEYVKTTTQTVAITDTEGLWFFYFVGETLTCSQDVWNIEGEDKAFVSIVYWDAANNKNIGMGIELHSWLMSGAVHRYLHNALATRFVSGLAVSKTTTTISVTNGILYDEDVVISIKDEDTPTSTWGQPLSPASVPVLYRDGANGYWRRRVPSTVPVSIVSNVLQINIFSGGNWILSPAAANKYVAYWIIASGVLGSPIFLVPGQEAADTLAAARDANLFTNMSFGSLPVVEFKVIARILVQSKSAAPYYNIEEVNDYRQSIAEPSSSFTAVDHGSLSGLLDDDHTQYYNASRITTWLSTITTTSLSEGTNLYFTNERVDDRVSSLIQNGTGISWTYDDAANTLTPAISLSTFTTTDLSEGTNLYFTDERVDDRVDALIQNGTGISWTYDDAANTLTPAISLSTFTTTDLSEGTNLYYTDEKVDDRVDALIQDTTKIAWTYDDAAGTLIPAISLISSDVGLGNVENTALSTWSGTSNITTIGTLSGLTISGSTPTLTIQSTDATDPTIHLISNTNEDGVKIYLDQSDALDSLQIEGQTSSVDTQINLIAKSGENSVITLSTTGYSQILHSSGDELTIRNRTSDKDIVFLTTRTSTLTEAMRIDGETGNIGIGTATPAVGLEIAKGPYSATQTEVLRFSRADAPTLRYHSIKTSHYSAAADNKIEFLLHDISTTTSQTSVMTLAGNGRVGVGTTAPQQTLDVAGTFVVGNTTDGVSIELQGTYGTILGINTSKSAYNPLDIRTGASTQLFLNTDGKIGIGTTEPAVALDNAGEYLGNEYIGFSRTGTSPNARAYFGYNSTKMNAVVQGIDGKGIEFNVNNNTFGSGTAMTILSTGNIGVGTTTPKNTLSINGGAELTNNSVMYWNAYYSNLPTPGFKATAAGWAGGAYQDSSGVFRISTAAATAAAPDAAVTLYQRLSAGPTELVINEDSRDIDFRVESDADTHAFFLQASDGKIGIGIDTPISKLTISGDGYTGGIHLSGGEAGSAIPLEIFSDYNFNWSYNNIFGNASEGISVQTKYSDGTGRPILLNPAKGYVGIGVAIPLTLLHIKQDYAILRVEDSTYSRLAAISRTMPGIEIVSNGLNSTTAAYGSALKFMSADTDLTTENPKLLAGIFPRATETYSADASGGMAMDFATTPNAPGTTNVPLVRMTIDQSGNVGIGTDSPGEILTVAKSDTVSSVFAKIVNYAGSAGAGTGILLSTSNNIASTAVGASIFASRTDAAASGDTDLLFRTSAGTTMTERMRILANGKVGIGTATPDFTLEVGDAAGVGSALCGSNSGILVGSASNAARLILVGGSQADIIFGDSGGATNNKWVYLTSSEQNLSFQHLNDAYAVERTALYIKNDGNVGIGTTSPVSMLHTKESGTTLWRGINVEESVDSAAGPMMHLLKTRIASQQANDNDYLGVMEWNFYNSADQYTAGAQIVGLVTDVTDTTEDVDLYFTQYIAGTSTEVMRFKGGNVGIGIAAPGATLDIQGPAASMRLKSTSAVNSVFFHTAGGTGSGNSCFTRYVDSSNVSVVDCGMDSYNSNNWSVMQPGTPYTRWLSVNTTNGYVGILDSTPSYPLDVNGDARIVGDLNVNTDLIVTGELKGSRQSATFSLLDSGVMFSGVYYYFKLGDVLTNSTKGLVMVRAGSIVGVSIDYDITATGASNPTLSIMKNGSGVWTVTLNKTIANGVRTQTTQARGTDTFAAGDRISIMIFGVTSVNIKNAIVNLEYVYDA